MPGDFFSAWNQSLPAAGSAFGESFTVNGTTYDAVCMDELDATARAGLAAPLINTTLTIEVTREVVTAAQIVRGTYLEARGKKLEVLESKDDGSGSLSLFCSSRAGTSH